LRSKISPQATADILRYLNVDSNVTITNRIHTTTMMDNIETNDDCNNGSSVNPRFDNNENIDNINLDDFL